MHQHDSIQSHGLVIRRTVRRESHVCQRRMHPAQLNAKHVHVLSVDVQQMRQFVPEQFRLATRYSL